MFLLHQNKFHRRNDLSPEIRFEIAYSALNNPSYGTITQLSRTHSTSRPFIYEQRDRLEKYGASLFELRPGESLESEVIRSLKYMLELRLIGKSSIESISELMKRHEYTFNSVGFISQSLKTLGVSLPSNIQLENGIRVAVVFASDEVFARQQPILITVDPVSSAILRMELAESRSGEVWRNHWEEILQNDCDALFVVSDEGKGLQTAQSKLFPDLVHQPDTYHGVAHQLGYWSKRLENAAWKAIENEYNAERLLRSSKSEKVLKRRAKTYCETQQITAKAIELCDNFQFLYRDILNNMQIFDSQGRVKNPTTAEENIKVAVEFLQSLGHNKVAKQAQKVQNLLPELLNFLPRAQKLTQQLKHHFPAGVLEAFCLAWQGNKNAIKAKNSKRKQFYLSQENNYLDVLKPWLNNQYQSTKEEIYSQLDTIVQSSSLVEAINSIIRPYFNTSKNQVSQHMLNLIMFYHNHRRYKAGKRKGRTPMELLTSKEQDKDWLDLMLEYLGDQDAQLAPKLAA